MTSDNNEPQQILLIYLLIYLFSFFYVLCRNGTGNVNKKDNKQINRKKNLQRYRYLSIYSFISIHFLLPFNVGMELEMTTKKTINK